MEKQELQKKIEQFAESVSGYKRAKQMVWKCGAGLCFLACIIGLVMLAQFFGTNEKNATTGIELLGLMVAGVAAVAVSAAILGGVLAGIIVVAGAVTHCINKKLQEKIVVFMEEMKGAGCSREEVDDGMFGVFPDRIIRKCLSRVFGNPGANEIGGKVEVFRSDIKKGEQQKMVIMFCGILFFVVVAKGINGIIYSNCGNGCPAGPGLTIACDLVLLALVIAVVVTLRRRLKNKRRQRLESFVEDLKGMGCPRDKIAGYLEKYYPTKEEAQEYLKQVFDKKESK